MMSRFSDIEERDREFLFRLGEHAEKKPAVAWLLRIDDSTRPRKGYLDPEPHPEDGGDMESWRLRDVPGAPLYYERSSLEGYISCECQSPRDHKGLVLTIHQPVFDLVKYKRLSRVGRFWADLFGV